MKCIKKYTTLVALASICFLTFALPQQTMAATKNWSWSGTTSNNYWSNDNRWNSSSCGFLCWYYDPRDGDDVGIGAPSSNRIAWIDTNLSTANLNSLSITGASGATATLRVGKTASGSDTTNSTLNSTTISINGYGALELSGSGKVQGSSSGSGTTLNIYSNGSFTQTGGTLTATNVAMTGGTFTRSGGTLKVGTLFDQSGGTSNFTGSTLTIDGTSNNIYAFTLSGGILTAPNIALSGGTFTKTGGNLRVSTLFNQSSGTSSFDVLTVDGAGTANNTVKAYTLSGGTLTAPTVALTGGTFTQNGGTLNANVTQSGGTVAGTLDVQSGKTFTYNSGTFIGQLISRGTATFNNNFTAGNGMINYSTLSIPTGRTITLNGAGLTNYSPGTVNLSGGTLNATSAVFESGSLSGAGTINAPVTMKTGTAVNMGLLNISSYDKLNITGAADFSGATLNISLMPGYSINLRETYSIITSTGLLTPFASLNLPDPDGPSGPLYFLAEYTANSLTLRVVPIPPTVWLLGAGLLSLVGIRRFRK